MPMRPELLWSPTARTGLFVVQASVNGFSLNIHLRVRRVLPQGKLSSTGIRHARESTQQGRESNTSKPSRPQDLRSLPDFSWFVLFHRDNSGVQRDYSIEVITARTSPLRPSSWLGGVRPLLVWDGGVRVLGSSSGLLFQVHLY
jgi:hypothetical protein